MAIPTQMLQPLFLFPYAVADSQYVAVAADWNAPTSVVLNRGIYCLTAVDVDISFGVGTPTATNGAHLPTGDTRMIVIPADATTLKAWLALGGSTAGTLNIAQVQPVPERF